MRPGIAAAVVVAGAIAIPSSASAHQYLGYFEYGRTEMSARGYAMAREVARDLGRLPDANVAVFAHMDAAEIEAFSEELAARRAQAVATELVLLGVQPARIRMFSCGADHLARPTDPGVPDAISRRVLVELDFPPASLGGGCREVGVSA